MNNLINIGNQEIAIKEFKGQRVITFMDIDLVHDRVAGTAKRNFAENRERLVEGEDYHVVSLKDENRTLGIDIPNRGITLITEQGYLMLVKSFTDDLAWEVQRQLVNTYFRTKNNLTGLSPELQMFQQIFNAVAKQELEVKNAKELSQKAIATTQAIKDTIVAEYDNWRDVIRLQINSIQKNSDMTYQNTYNTLYDNLEKRARCDLSARVRNGRNRLADSGATKTKIEAFGRMDVIEADARLKEIFTSIVKEFSIKYVA